MVQRLEWDACDAHNCHCDIIESEDGDMVSYEDYEKLNSLVQELAAAVDMSKLSHRDREQLRELGYL